MDPNSANQPCHLADAAATAEFGRWLSARLLESRRQRLAAIGTATERGAPAHQLVLLQGELGAGKTCLVRGLAEGLGIEEPITSPTFALAQHYRGQTAHGPTALVHLDLYRLEESAAADELFFQEEEAAVALEAVMAVEWSERLSFRPEAAWCLELGFESEGRWVRLRREWPPSLGAGRRG